VIANFIHLRVSRALPTHTIEVARVLDTLQVHATQKWSDPRDTQVETTWAIGKIVDEYAPDVRRRIVVEPSWLARALIVCRSAVRVNR
jgi:hypothetical protein